VGRCDEILKSQLATKSTRYTHDGADVTITIALTFDNICQAEEPLAGHGLGPAKFSEYGSLLNLVT